MDAFDFYMAGTAKFESFVVQTCYSFSKIAKSHITSTLIPPDILNIAPPTQI